MTTSTRFPLLLLVAATLLAGCAGSREAARAPHPLAGAWAYSIDTPQGVFTGTLTFAEVEEALTGAIASSEQPDESAPLEDLSFDGSTLTFKFDSGQYGILSVTATVEGDAFDGLMNVGAFGVDVPIKGNRKTESTP